MYLVRPLCVHSASEVNAWDLESAFSLFIFFSRVIFHYDIPVSQKDHHDGY